MNATDGVFSALADPTRRQLVEWLDGGATANATELAQRLPISRQAVTKHLKELEAAGLIVSSKHGREIRYAANERGLDHAEIWLANRSAHWEERLDRIRSRVARG
jgi:DNA-binding transcriptional ArsR family regulator